MVNAYLDGKKQYDPKKHNEKLEELRAEFATKRADSDAFKVKPASMEGLVASLNHSPERLNIVGPLSVPSDRIAKEMENKLKAGKAKSLEQHKNFNYG
jgi:hypothetical protein